MFALRGLPSHFLSPRMVSAVVPPPLVQSSRASDQILLLFPTFLTSQHDVHVFVLASPPPRVPSYQMGIKWIFVLALVWVQAVYYKRWRWSPIKSRKLVVDAVN